MAQVTCTVCPLGCRLTVDEKNGKYQVEGNTCKRGEKYGIEEMTNPKRVVTTTVKLKDAYVGLLPVKTQEVVPKALMMDIMRELDKIIVTPPVQVGDIIVENILNTHVNVVSTKAI
jgi:CxxC motif-containing protein